MTESKKSLTQMKMSNVFNTVSALRATRPTNETLRSASTSCRHLNMTTVSRPDSFQHTKLKLCPDGPSTISVTTGKLVQREWSVRKRKLSGNCAEKTSDKDNVHSCCHLPLHKARARLETRRNHSVPKTLQSVASSTWRQSRLRLLHTSSKFEDSCSNLSK